MKMVFTTGEAAEICNISQQTIIRCFDSGRLKGFRVPGSRFRRIPRESLINFMKEHGIPLDNLDSGKNRILIVGNHREAFRKIGEALGQESKYEVRMVAGTYEAGVVSQEFMPDLMLVDGVRFDGEAQAICNVVRGNPVLQPMRLVIIGNAPEAEVNQLLEAGANEYLREPASVEEAVAKVGELLA